MHALKARVFEWATRVIDERTACRSINRPALLGPAARCASDGRRVRGDEPAVRWAAARHIRRAGHDRREPNTAAGSPPKKIDVGGARPACSPRFGVLGA